MKQIDVFDLQVAQCHLEGTLVCLNPECNEPEPNVVYNSQICDARCQHCGEWQEDLSDAPM